MSEQQTEQQAPKTVSHADMFFRYISALAGAAGVQAYTLAIAVPKEDGTSGIMSMSSIAQDSHPKWKNEVARLLVSNALKSATELMTPETDGTASLDSSNGTEEKAAAEA